MNNQCSVKKAKHKNVYNLNIEMYLHWTPVVEFKFRANFHFYTHPVFQAIVEDAKKIISQKYNSHTINEKL